MVRKCSIKGCRDPHLAQRLCDKHYRALRRRTNQGRYVELKRRAQRDGLILAITSKQHAAIITSPCEYCREQINPTGSGLDRKDNSKGYTLENVVPCCKSCNRIKNCYLTYEEMKAAMRAVLRVRGEKFGKALCDIFKDSLRGT